LSFSIIQEFETLMQEPIKKVINIHKYKFFYAGRGPARAGYGLMRVGPLRAHYPSPPRVFFAG